MRHPFLYPTLAPPVIPDARSVPGVQHHTHRPIAQLCCATRAGSSAGTLQAQYAVVRVQRKRLRLIASYARSVPHTA
eukprot:1868705-Rhodomonas_salina.3